jgi:hypothetical protein
MVPVPYRTVHKKRLEESVYFNSEMNESDLNIRDHQNNYQINWTLKFRKFFFIGTYTSLQLLDTNHSKTHVI